MAIDTQAARYPAELADDLTKVAEELGVFVDLTKKQEVPVDQTGGLDRLREILREKSSANDVVVVAEPQPARPTITGQIGRFARAVRAWARRAVSAVKETLAWLATPFVELARKLRLNRQGVFYTSRHAAQRRWYGVQRSTVQRNAAARRNAARQPADSEPALPDLPEYFVSYLALCIETMRGHEDALHPKAGYQFRC